jgi:RNA polymerase sigma-70 factor, ECF subfamily
MMCMTELLRQLRNGDNRVMDDIVPLVYDELKKLARVHLRREIHPAPLETTGLVHEAFLKLAGGKHPDYENRAHFYGIASRLMRQVLVDASRARYAEKRGAALEIAVAQLPDVALHPDQSVLALDEALQQLERSDPQKARLIEMRYFAGMTAEECSTVLSIPVHKVRRDLRVAQAWLRKEIAAVPAPHAASAP